MKERCDKCRFWDRSDPPFKLRTANHKEDLEGHCRRHPPQFDIATVMLAGKEAEAEDEDAGEAMLEESGCPYAWAFPVVCGRDWCGDFQPTLPLRKKKK